MIPKKIHYCWFGPNEKPEIVIKCMESWKKFAPDFEIIEWNEENYDYKKMNYTKEAYEAKKYAFVADVCRFDILNEVGGIYLDTDVELIKPIEELLDNKCFLAYDQFDNVNPGLVMGCQKDQVLLKLIINQYRDISFLNSFGKPNITSITTYVNNVLEKQGFFLDGEEKTHKGIKFYPAEYFDPLNYETRILNITEHTISIHHYTGSWKSNKDRFITKVGFKLKKIVGPKIYQRLADLKHKIYG